MRQVRLFNSILAVAVMLTAACGAQAVPARTLSYAELVKNPASGRHAFDGGPLILAFEPGDRLPIDLGFDDESFALDPASPPLALVAKERCYVRIDEHGVRSSRDPARFDEKPKAPGSFMLGFSHRDTGPSLQVRVRTPRKP
jgi:hypothetical protein